MQLVWFETNGFKRFAERCNGNFDSKLVAIVGPNEAGKSSVLEALERLNEARDFLTSGPSQETTRGKNFKADHAILKATYLIDDSDKAALAEIAEAKDLRWCIFSQRVKGTATFASLLPAIKRDISKRQATSAILKKSVNVIEQAQQNIHAVDKAAQPNTQNALDVKRLIKLLESTSDSLTAGDIQIISNHAALVGAIAEGEAPAIIGQLAKMLTDLAQHESAPTPDELVRTILWERVPKYLNFTDDDRLLKSEYNLEPFFRAKEQKREAIPKSLENLTDACGLNIKDLFNARRTTDEGRIETLLDSANEKLRKLMELNWSQSNATVRLRLDGETLHILVGTRSSQFVRIAERSEGLRQFVALLMFLHRVPNLKVKPVVLIDEVERHLHYDAQADLVQMLARQNVASKVIYATHSIGCLPEDLGSGVRLVEYDGDNSRIVNWFWDNHRPGFSRLLFAMGASTLAFIPVRYSVVTEGATDLLLLPALLKAATARDVLGFQVVPGLSSASEDQVAIINSESPRTVFLTDGDDEAGKLRKKIVGAGISNDLILKLPAISESSTVIEDFVALETYLNAVNSELARSHGDAYQLDATKFSPTNRTSQVAKMCGELGIDPPNKRAVAYRILENRHEKTIVARDTIELLQDLHRNICDRLRIPAS